MERDNFCFNNITEKKLINTGLAAMARAPIPAVTYCMAITYTPRYTVTLRNPYKAICVHSFPYGKRSHFHKCAIHNMIIAAIPNRITDITKGCATVKLILVAVAADAHSIAKKKPARIHEYPGFPLLFSKY